MDVCFSLNSTFASGADRKRRSGRTGGKSRVGHWYGGLSEQLHGTYCPAGLKIRTVKFPAGLKTTPFRVGWPIEPEGFLWACPGCLYLPLLSSCVFLVHCDCNSYLSKAFLASYHSWKHSMRVLKEEGWQGWLHNMARYPDSRAS